MRSREFISKIKLPKGEWVIDISHADKHELGHELIDLVQHAYHTTHQGSFVNSLRQVLPSDWDIMSLDGDDISCCVFYRKPRPNESWQGRKIQGIGHDGRQASKYKVIQHVSEMLLMPGYWIESSHAMRSILRKVDSPAVTDEELLRKLFKDPDLRMIDQDTYKRVLPNGSTITETVFGYPVLRTKKA